MNDDLPRIPNPELFFGFVAPIGADVDGPVASLKEYFEGRKYRVEVIKVTKVFAALRKAVPPKKKLKISPKFSRYKTHIAYGNQLREYFDDNAFPC